MSDEPLAELLDGAVLGSLRFPLGQVLAEVRSRCRLGYTSRFAASMSLGLDPLWVWRGSWACIGAWFGEAVRSAVPAQRKKTERPAVKMAPAVALIDAILESDRSPSTWPR